MADKSSVTYPEKQGNDANREAVYGLIDLHWPPRRNSLQSKAFI